MFGFVGRTKTIKSRMLSLVQLNLELAKLEAKQKATALGVAGGLAALGAVLVVYAIGFVGTAAPLFLAGAVLVGMAAIAELGFGLMRIGRRHILTSALVRRGLIC